MRKSNGIGSLAAVIVENVVRDFLFAPPDSAAYRTARKFIYGGECSHVVCGTCSEESWREGECPPGPYALPCECGHGPDVHMILMFDWTEHRDLITSAAGIEPGTLKEIAECTPALTAAKRTHQRSTSTTSKGASRRC